LKGGPLAGSAILVTRPEHQAGELAVGVEVVDVDRGVDDAVVDGAQVAGQLERPGGAHRVAGEALRGVVPHAGGVADVLAHGAALAGGARGRRGGGLPGGEGARAVGGGVVDAELGEGGVETDLAVDQGGTEQRADQALAHAV